MNDKNENLHFYDGDDKYPVRKQMRWTDFDYGSRHVNFITITSLHRRELFGYVDEGMMHLNRAGEMVWEEIRHIERPGVVCTDAVVMPNHVHLVVGIGDDAGCDVPSLMGAFKSITTNRYIEGVHREGWAPFLRHVWQRSYWDDIIWNDRMYEYVRQYIATNPERWRHDEFNQHHDGDVDGVSDELRRLRI